MTNVLVLGAAGFIGRALGRFVSELPCREEFALHGVDASPSDLCPGYETLMVGDVLSGSVLIESIERAEPDYVLYLVGSFSMPDFDSLLDINCRSGVRLLEVLKARGFWPKKIVFSGSAAEYGIPEANPVRESATPRPLSLYGLTKLCMTEAALTYHRAYGAPCVIARTFNVIGEGLSTALSIGSFSKQIREAPDGGTISVGNLDTRRDFITVEAVCELYWRLLLKGTPGEIYNVCSGSARSIRSVLDDMILASGKRLHVELDTARLKANDVPEIFGSREKIDGIQ
jgi:GDP-4-dehydro-6-deoxy-D-mannose reductase